MSSHADDHLAWVSEANLAPSVHNTQPARWRFLDNEIELLADPERFLSVGDPSLNDAALSCGAALEGMVIALSARGLGISEIQDCWHEELTSPDGYRLAARIGVGGTCEEDFLRTYIDKRFTWRGKFKAVTPKILETIADWGDSAPVCTLATDHNDLAWLADLNDELSLTFFSDKPYRDELRSWMRLSQGDPNWETDGLNANAMQMSGIEAFGAKFALASPAFEIAKALGFAGAMISERTKTLSASGVAFFHTPKEMSSIAAGRHFYRMWLELTRLGVTCWPMAVLADEPVSNAACKTRFGVPDDHRLVNVLRFGACANQDQRPQTARLSPKSLILN